MFIHSFKLTRIIVRQEKEEKAMKAAHRAAREYIEHSRQIADLGQRLCTSHPETSATFNIDGTDMSRDQVFKLTVRHYVDADKAKDEMRKSLRIAIANMPRKHLGSKVEYMTINKMVACNAEEWDGIAVSNSIFHRTCWLLSHI
jgi:phage-related minor tail protein